MKVLPEKMLAPHASNFKNILEVCKFFAPRRFPLSIALKPTKNWLMQYMIRWNFLVFSLLFLTVRAFGFDVPQKVKLVNSIQTWKKGGFVEMVPLLELPSDVKKLDSITVWVKIPGPGKISANYIADQKRYSLVYPPGTVADRVELYNGQISDVRGARIDQNGDTFFHDYETAPGYSDKWLVGYEWKRADDAADQQAANFLVGLYFPPGEDSDTQAIAHFRQLNHCGACHEPDAPAPATTAPPFRFETDSRGFFQPQAVLEGRMTVRDHRDWDLTADDPFVTVWCGTQAVKATTTSDSRYYVCPGDAAPEGTLDLKSALAKKNPHALALCASRAFLYSHMDGKAQMAFKSAVDECL
jgi:hypothetical protein